MGWTWALLGLVVIFTYKADTEPLEKNSKFTTSLSVGALLGALSENIHSKKPEEWRPWLYVVKLISWLSVRASRAIFFYYIHCIVVVLEEV